jgi:hypothetical protein
MDFSDGLLATDAGFMNLLVQGPAVIDLGIAAFCGFAATALGLLADIREAVTKQPRVGV